MSSATTPTDDLQPESADLAATALMASSAATAIRVALSEQGATPGPRSVRALRTVSTAMGRVRRLDKEGILESELTPDIIIFDDTAMAVDDRVSRLVARTTKPKLNLEAIRKLAEFSESISVNNADAVEIRDIESSRRFADTLQRLARELTRLAQEISDREAEPSESNH